MNQHLKFSSNCRLLMGNARDNVPINLKELNKKLSMVPYNYGCDVARGETVSEGNVNPQEIYRLDMERLEFLAQKLGFILLKK